jgi:hypothetical protein
VGVLVAAQGVALEVVLQVVLPLAVALLLLVAVAALGCLVLVAAVAADERRISVVPLSGILTLLASWWLRLWSCLGFSNRLGVVLLGRFLLPGFLLLPERRLRPVGILET